jgi:hypothetical protein
MLHICFNKLPGRGGMKPIQNEQRYIIERQLIKIFICQTKKGRTLKNHRKSLLMTVWPAQERGNHYRFQSAQKKFGTINHKSIFYKILRNFLYKSILYRSRLISVVIVGFLKKESVNR